jgi:Mg2+ and Co2+ transporter CorA
VLKTLLYDENNQFRVIENPEAISDVLRIPHRLLWLDLEKPDISDLQMLQQEFTLHPLAIEDAVARHQRPKVDQYQNFYLVVFYIVGLVKEPSELSLRPAHQAQSGLRAASFLRNHLGAGAAVGAGSGAKLPESRSKKGASDDSGSRPDGSAESTGYEERIALHELTMFLGENYLITVHDGPLPELDEVARRWRRNAEAIIPDDKSAGGLPGLPGTRPLTSQERGHLNMQPPPPHDRAPMPDNGNNGNNGRAGGAGRTGRAEQLGGGGPAEARADLTAPYPPKPDQPPDIWDRGSASQGVQSTDIGILLYSLLDTIVDDYFPVIDTIVERVEDLEESVFRRFNQQAIESIFALKKDLLALRKVLAPERDVLNVLVRRDLPIFQEHTIVYFQDVYDHVVRITDSIDTYRDLLSSALDSYLSMQSNRLNITVQTLTSVSIMLMSLSAVTGWYGMNFDNMPELQQWWGYTGVILVVAVILILEFRFFRGRGWL